MERSSTDQLDQHLSELKGHLDDGRNRVIAAYDDDVTPPESYPPLEQPPHEYLFERTAKLAFFGAKLVDLSSDMESPIPEAEYLVYGVAAEILVAGVHLKTAPEEFITDWKENGQTPSFSDSRSVLLNDIGSKLSDDDIGVLTLALKILRRHRNNLAHIGFHQAQFSPHRVLFWEIFAELLRYYANDPVEEVQLLKDRVEKFRTADAVQGELRFSIDP